MIDVAVQHLASDNTSGAAEILARARGIFALLKNRWSELGIDDLEKAHRAVLKTSIAITTAQPHMSPLLRLASVAFSAAKNINTAGDVPESVEAAATLFIEWASRSSREAALNGAALISANASVLTHSRSSTVLESLIEAKRGGRSFSVFATESRPMLEGRSLAKSLIEEGIPVTLIADSAAARVVNHVEMVLVGADKVISTEIINKIGTRMIALAARDQGVPVYSICDSSKFVKDDYGDSLTRDAHDASELWADPPAGVKLQNNYFEATPIRYFTGVVTEDGVLSPEAASRRVLQITIEPELTQELYRTSVK